MALTNLIKTIQNIMRKDAGVDGDAQRIAQLGWMIFLKIYDEREKELELLNPDYESPIPEKYRWRSWAKDEEGITGDALLEFIDNGLFKDLSEIESQDEKELLIKSVFEDSNNYMKSGTLLRQVVNELNKIDFNTSEDRHLFNDIYEKILKDLQSAGNAGEFYTPRAVTQFIIETLDPKVGDKILDPACGTGGFLVSAIKYVREHYVNNAEDEKTLQESIHGKELKQLPHLLAVTNMIINGVDIPKAILHTDTLSKPIRDYQPSDKVDIVATNPPFGGATKDGTEKNFPSEFRTKETADLFLVLIMRILKDQGKAGVVLPDGFLFGEGVKTRIKEQLIDKFNLHTIVRLPKGVFAPYTSINTNILFFDKSGTTKDIWFYEHQYPKGYKSYSKTKPITIQEFDVEKKWWDNRIENEFAWKISREEIEERDYNLDIKNPHQVEAETQDPEILLKKYTDIKQEVNLIKDEIKTIITAALNE